MSRIVGRLAGSIQEIGTITKEDRIPFLGVGIGYRRDLNKEVVEHVKEFDCLELVCESFFRSEKVLLALKSLVPVIPHSLAMSVGSRLNPEYLQRVKRIVELTGNAWYGDHLCFTNVDGVATGHLTPIPWTEEALETVTTNVKQVMATIGPNFALENIANPFLWPNSTMSESEFVNELVRRTRCHLLLDLENVRVNSTNHAFDPRKFIASLPLERVVQVHIAGGDKQGGISLDSHDRPVPEETWGLLEYLVDHHRPRATILERDYNIRGIAELVQEVRRARSIVGGPGH